MPAMLGRQRKVLGTGLKLFKRESCVCTAGLFLLVQFAALGTFALVPIKTLTIWVNYSRKKTIALPSSVLAASDSVLGEMILISC